jgi:hypothetical protein
MAIRLEGRQGAVEIDTGSPMHLNAFVSGQGGQGQARFAADFVRRQ